MGLSEVRTSNGVIVKVDGEDIEFVFFNPKNCASLVLLHVNQPNCFLFLKY